MHLCIMQRGAEQTECRPMQCACMGDSCACMGSQSPIKNMRRMPWPSDRFVPCNALCRRLQDGLCEDELAIDEVDEGASFPPPTHFLQDVLALYQAFEEMDVNSDGRVSVGEIEGRPDHKKLRLKVPVSARELVRVRGFEYGSNYSNSNARS